MSNGWIGSAIKAGFIAWKDAKIYFFKWPNIMFGLILPSVLYLAFSIGRPVEPSSAVPGLVAMAALFGAGAIQSVALPLERRTGTFDRLLAAPISLFTIILGKTLGGFFFGVVLSVAYAVIVIPFSGSLLGNPLLFILSVAVSSLTFSALGLFASAPFRDVPEAMPPATLMRIVMVFICGVFIPVDTMPTSLQVAAYLLPLTYSLDALRQAMTGPVAIPTFLIDVLIQIMYSIVLLFAATKILERTIQ